MSSTKALKTVMTDLTSYDTKNLIFGKYEERNIPNSTLTYGTLDILTKNPDGTTGHLIFSTNKDVFSFKGITENTSMEDPTKVTGHSVGFGMWDREAVDDMDKLVVKKFEEICDVCKNYILTNKKSLGKQHIRLDISDLKKMNPLYWGVDEDGNKQEDKAPSLYVKLFESKDKKDAKGNSVPAKIFTSFYNMSEVDVNGDYVEMEASDLFNTSMYVRPAIKIESIFLGSVNKLQLKLMEANVRLVERQRKRLLRALPCSEVSTGISNPFEKVLPELPVIKEEVLSLTMPKPKKSSKILTAED